MKAVYQVDVPRSGVENMALDQSMLEQTANDGVLRLRVYQWSMPTVSLGYFQKYAEYLGFESTRGVSVVRRSTGGGAIVHHYDWTYAIAVPAAVVGRGDLGASTRLYNCLHLAVTRWLEGFGVRSLLWQAGMSAPACSSGGCSFLCFERRHAGDVICDSMKIMGSAQRRLGSALLQHGSLLLQRSPFAATLPGIAELTGTLLTDQADFANSVVAALAADLSIQFECCDCERPLVPISSEARTRFESPQWLARI